MKAALLFAIPAALIAAPGADDSFVLKNATVHTMAGAEIQNGSVVVRNGKIIGVGKNLAVPKDLKVIDAKGMQVYPGMIDAATQVGLVEINSIRESEDVTELGKFNPQLVALTAVNPSSEHIPVTRVNGITTVAATPEGSLIGGQVSLVHLDGWTTDEMGIKPHAGLQLRFPTIALPGGRGGNIDADPSSPFAAARSYTTLKQAYDKDIAELNEFFESARRYKLTKDAKAPGFKPDLRLDTMIPVIEGKEPVLVEAPRERDIRDAIAFADKQKIKIILLDPAEAYKVTNEIRDHNIPVILGPSLALPLTEDGNYDQAYKTPLALQKAGIEFCFATLTGGSNLASRNLPYQAGQAVAFGLSKEDAMKAVTKNAADIWGVGDQIGTVEEGKWADLVVTDGDPLEAQTQIKLLFVKGKPVDLNNKQKELYEKYLNRP